MTYEEALRFWYGRINYEQKAPTPGDFKLERMRGLLAKLGNPQDRLRIVHIAGTKGKGSTSAMVASILKSAGFRTGLFTSPHLEDVAERYQIDFQSISRAELATLLTEIGEACLAMESGRDRLAEPLTFFEISTALGLLHFVRRRVEWAVLEVGLGGRLDSTNVCSPNVGVITTISFDHTAVLGSTLAKIAWEKAGIVKSGRRTVSGVREPQAREVIEAVCHAKQAPLCQIDREFTFAQEPAIVTANSFRPLRLAVRIGTRTLENLEVSLVGEHQALNAAVAVATVFQLKVQGVPIGEDAIRKGLANLFWPGRLERLGDRPLVLVDCAHNVTSAEAFVAALKASYPKSGKRILIFAASRDKDLTGMLAVLTPYFDTTVLTRFEKNPRSVPPEHLLEMLGEDERTKCRTAATVAEAWSLAKSLADADDTICIAGSVFLAGEIRHHVMHQKPSSAS